MQFGELSDDFYKYCRRWMHNREEYVRNVVKEIEGEEPTVPPPSFALSFNFKHFTAIMMRVHQDDLVPISLPCSKKQSYPRLGMSFPIIGAGVLLSPSFSGSIKECCCVNEFCVCSKGASFLNDEPYWNTTSIMFFYTSPRFLAHTGMPSLWLGVRANPKPPDSPRVIDSGFIQLTLCE